MSMSHRDRTRQTCEIDNFRLTREVININDQDQLIIFIFIIMDNKDKLDDLVTEHIIELFEKKDFKKRLIKKLNENVDVPIINEKTEKKVLNKIYDLLVLAIKELKD